MKSVKRISSLLLALLMILTMSVTTFAAGAAGTTEIKGSIIIANPLEGHTYTAYKIFDVVYNEDKTAYSYTIDSSRNEWFSTVQTYAGIPGKGLTLTQVNGGTTYIVETTDKFSAPDFSNALKDAVGGKNGTPLAVTDGKASATGLDLGYYFVTSTSGALCNLTTTNPSVTIHDKNEVLFKKEANKTSADVGETVNYTITGKVPDYTGFTTYTYKIADEMSEGLTFNKNVTVTVGGENKTSECKLTYDVESNANKFTVSIPVKDQKYTVGAKIEVKYTATLNKKAIAAISSNKATLEYSNDPTKSEETKKIPSEQKVYSSKIEIVKYDKDNQSKKLSGAEFVLYKEDDASVKQYYKCDATTKNVTWVAEKANATVAITVDGAASFEGLANGTYYLEEIKAPAGYNLLSGPQEIKVDVNADNETLITTAKVANSTGTILPSTGGMGTTLFYVIGGIFVLASVVLLITRKRMEKVEK